MLLSQFLWVKQTFTWSSKNEKKKEQQEKNKRKQKCQILLWDQCATTVKAYERDDPWTCAGIKCISTTNYFFLVTFHRPWILENDLTLKKKQKQNSWKKEDQVEFVFIGLYNMKGGINDLFFMLSA